MLLKDNFKLEHVFAGRVKIISHSSCRPSALLNYFCPLCLQNLYLEGNELTTLPDELFDKLPNLQWLDLRRNYLIRLPTVYTGRHQNLRNLLLEGNNLRTLPLELGESLDLGICPPLFVTKVKIYKIFERKIVNIF